MRSCAACARFDVAPTASVVLLVCDMPLVTPDLLRCIADRPAATVIPVARGRAQYGCAKYGGRVLAAMCDASDAGTRSFKWLDRGELQGEVDWIDEAVWGTDAERGGVSRRRHAGRCT